MHANQHNSTGQTRNLNVRLAPDLLERLERAVSERNARRAKGDAPLTKADLVRDALLRHLHALETATDTHAGVPL